jgi:hypothetical protein
MNLRLLALAPLLLGLAACGGDDTVARDPGSADPTGPAAPPDLALPAEVRTATLAMVMDTGSGPEVCLGPIVESWPPQCSGPALLDWDWSEHEMHEKQGRIRWGSFAITGSWDGEALTASDAIPAALYDVMAQEPTTPADPDPAVSAAELERIAEELPDLLPGVQGTYADDTHVLADVTYDDGSLQEWADATYGEGVVVLVAALVPVEPLSP